jgi:hypothetical protein
MLPQSSRSIAGLAAVRSILFHTVICGTWSAPISFKHRTHGMDLLVAVRAGGIDHVQQQIGLCRLLQRRLKCRHQGMRQIANETDRIGQYDRAGAFDEYPSRSRVEGGEQLVGGIGARPGQALNSVLLPALV